MGGYFLSELDLSQLGRCSGYAQKDYKIMSSRILSNYNHLLNDKASIILPEELKTDFKSQCVFLMEDWTFINSTLVEPLSLMHYSKAEDL